MQWHMTNLFSERLAFMNFQETDWQGCCLTAVGKKASITDEGCFPPLPLLPAIHYIGKHFVIKHCFLNTILTGFSTFWSSNIFVRESWSDLFGLVSLCLCRQTYPLCWECYRRWNYACHLKLSYGEVNVKV